MWQPTFQNVTVDLALANPAGSGPEVVAAAATNKQIFHVKAVAGFQGRIEKREWFLAMRKFSRSTGICHSFLILCRAKLQRHINKHLCWVGNPEENGKLSVHVKTWPQEQIYSLLFEFLFPSTDTYLKST